MKDHEIFVFGSNLAGIHGAGSAYRALSRYGAITGRGVGPQGHAYAIPTKGISRSGGIGRVLPLHDIELYVADFLDYAYTHPELTFIVVAIGCGLAGYVPEQIAPMFTGAPPNVTLPPAFVTVLTARTP
jgi:hypothetical protein